MPTKAPKPARPQKVDDSDELKGVELDLDAWPKFEALMKSAAKMGHKPHKVKSREAKKRKK